MTTKSLTLKNGTEFVAAAIEGFELQKLRIDSQITELRQLLGERQEIAPELPQTTHKRSLSPSARRRIQAAQKARWEKFRAEKNGGSRTEGTVDIQTGRGGKQKRKLSAEAKRAISEATKKRWALYRKQKAATA